MSLHVSTSVHNGFLFSQKRQDKAALCSTRILKNNWFYMHCCGMEQPYLPTELPAVHLSFFMSRCCRECNGQSWRKSLWEDFDKEVDECSGKPLCTSGSMPKVVCNRSAAPVSQSRMDEAKQINLNLIRQSYLLHGQTMGSSPKKLSLSMANVMSEHNVCCLQNNNQKKKLVLNRVNFVSFSSCINEPRWIIHGQCDSTLHRYNDNNNNDNDRDDSNNVNQKDALQRQGQRPIGQNGGTTLQGRRDQDSLGGHPSIKRSAMSF